MAENPITRFNIDEIPRIETGFLFPVENTDAELLQGYNGPWSHYAMSKMPMGDENFVSPNALLVDDRFCIDIITDPSTPVLASRDGVVIGFLEKVADSYDGHDPNIGLSVMTNAIFLRHDDATCTIYSHLEKGSVTQEGIAYRDKVKQGDVIGRTGLSGWIGGTPHLHFSSYRPRDGIFRRISSPTLFTNYDRPLEHSSLSTKQ